MTHPATRRTVLLATGAAALAVGCSDKGDGGSAPEASKSPAAGTAGTPRTESPAAPAGRELAATADIPVGGGTIFKEEKVVVTQPSKGEFKAFSAICTHQGCTVTSVADKTINCACHRSSFSIEDGAVTAGPATRPLPAEKITVEGGAIKLV
ncbi:Rieske (2Fe-2S) protein [Streptomyces sp. NPDC001857]|uniref:Rieske (2Fe-2S) protein n=1 Tax=unclassified Streptomyces TaxID=2593676 RepID=UPI00332CDA89